MTNAWRANSPMSGAVITMAIVGAVCLVVGIWLFVVRTRTEAGVYRNRIAATMLAAAGIVLIGYALTLNAWDAA